MRLFLRVSDDGFTAILYARIFQMSFHPIRARLAFSAMMPVILQKCGWKGVFRLVFLLFFYDLLDAIWFVIAACMIFVQ